jgi:hypothetical protein
MLFLLLCWMSGWMSGRIALCVKVVLDSTAFNTFRVENVGKRLRMFCVETVGKRLQDGVKMLNTPICRYFIHESARRIEQKFT